MQIGDTYTFSWYTGRGTNSLQLSRDNGSTWTEIYSVAGDIDDPTTLLSYEWTVTGPAATQCLVKMVDSEDSVEIIGSAFEIAASSSAATLNHSLSLSLGVGL